MATRVRCPGCGREHEWSSDNPWRPFCSDRCRLIDLGAWLDERHRIPADPEAAEELNPGMDTPLPRAH
jgi:endogenous inhibitor of DNA gyrase (YacG/DUF329 family)